MVFVYCPKSGDRVFAERPCSDLAVVRWQNGSRHVAGGVRLTLRVADPGAWWRSDAKSIAARIVAAVGGIAWDAQGTIEMIVPARAASRAAQLLTAVGGARVDRRAEDAMHAAAGTALDPRLGWLPANVQPAPEAGAWQVFTATCASRTLSDGTDQRRYAVHLTSPDGVVHVQPVPHDWSGDVRMGYRDEAIRAPADVLDGEVVRVYPAEDARW